MEIADIKTLYDYDRWATGRVLETAESLTPEQFTAPSPLGGPGVRDTLVHIVDAIYGWRWRWEERDGDAPDLNPADYGDIATVRDRWQAELRDLDVFLSSLSDADLARKVGPHSLGLTLAHVANHGTQHRSEVAMLLTHYDRSPGDLDLSYFNRAFAAKPS